MDARQIPVAEQVGSTGNARARRAELEARCLDRSAGAARRPTRPRRRRQGSRLGLALLRVQFGQALFRFVLRWLEDLRRRRQRCRRGLGRLGLRLGRSRWLGASNAAAAWRQGHREPVLHLQQRRPRSEDGGGHARAQQHEVRRDREHDARLEAPVELLTLGEQAIHRFVHGFDFSPGSTYTKPI